VILLDLRRTSAEVRRARATDDYPALIVALRRVDILLDRYLSARADVRRPR
jgi:hypothetical protein